MEDGKKALRDKKTYDTWQEGFAQIFEAVLENKPFIMNVYHSVRREKIESFLYKLTYQLIADVVEEKCSRDHLPETDKQFIADFYKYGFVGVMLDWIGKGMKDDYRNSTFAEIVHYIVNQDRRKLRLLLTCHFSTVIYN